MSDKDILLEAFKQTIIQQALHIERLQKVIREVHEDNCGCVNPLSYTQPGDMGETHE